MASMVSSSLLFLTLLFISSEAKDFFVGGSSGAWKVPSSTTDSLNKWAEAGRFQVGDALVFKYDGKKDSVLQVTREAYLSCNTTSPMKEHTDGSTTVRLHRQGAFYFISGAKGACEEGEKLIVVVMSPRHRYVSAAPAPAPMEYDGPAVAPTSGAAGVRRGLVSALVALTMVGMVV